MYDEIKNIIARSGTRAQLLAAGQLQPGQLGVCTDEKRLIYRRRLNAVVRPGEYDEFTSASKRVTRDEVSGGIVVFPNDFHVFGELATVIFELGAITNATCLNEYHFTFLSGATPSAITWPSTLKWVSGEEPIIEANRKYEVSILDNVVFIVGVPNVA